MMLQLQLGRSFFFFFKFEGLRCLDVLSILSSLNFINVVSESGFSEVVSTCMHRLAHLCERYVLDAVGRF